MKIKYTKWYFEGRGKRRRYVYVPIVEILLVGNHKIGRATKAYLDSGAMFNIFPAEYATNLLGYSGKTLKKGEKLPILGVGGSTTTGYGHGCTIQHPEFSIKNALVYFVENQPYPLLGRYGFMDKFKKIIFDEESQLLELLK